MTKVLYDYDKPDKVLEAYNDLARKISELYKDYTPHSNHAYVLDRIMHQIEVDMQYIQDIQEEME
jgi:hypothetical protein